MFNDVDLREKLLAHRTQFSSTNSMNVGRWYHKWLLCICPMQLVKAGHIQNGDESTDATGNFEISWLIMHVRLVVGRRCNLLLLMKITSHRLLPWQDTDKRDFKE